MVSPFPRVGVDQTSDDKKPCLDVIQKDGYDVFSYAGAKQALGDLGALEAQGAETNTCWPHLLSDVYSSLYKATPTERAETEAPEAHKRLVRQTMESLDYGAMRARTKLNRAGAAIATLELGEELLKQLPQGEPKRDEADPNDRGWSYLNGCSGEIDQGRKVRGMVRQAKRRAAETMETMQALGYGSGEGSGGEVDMQEAASVARRLRQDDKLRRIAALAGRMRRLAMAKRKTRLKRQPEDVVGVELGDDLQRVLPEELADLSGPFQPLFLLRWAERSLLQLELEGTQSLGQGPIVVCIDESSSMEGQREVWAKALALGVLAIAQHEKREFAVISFASSSQQQLHRFGKGASFKAVLSVLDHFFAGGTDFARPLDQAMALIEAADADDPMARADVIMITDGECQLSSQFVRSYKQRAEAKRVSTYSIYVGTRGRSLNEISDGAAYVSDLTRDGEAVELAFGI